MRPALLLLGFIFLTSSLNAQLRIEGTVTDTKSGKPVAGVNVYLANTTIGASTNAKGNYKINNVPSGVYVLVFSFIGYKTKTLQLEVKNGSSTRRIEQALQPHSVEMNELRVDDSNKEWRKNFKEFRKAFIGQTPFAKETTIENPWIINFQDDKTNNELIATARKPLVVINEALGYKLHIELVEFRWSKSNDTGIYKTYPRYVPIKSSSRKQIERWRRNRIEAYLGSSRHFLKSLYTDSIGQNHFSVLDQPNIRPISISDVHSELMQRGGPTSTIHDAIKGYKINRLVRVRYRNTQRIDTEDGRQKIRVKKKGAVKSNTENRLFFVRKTGKLVDPASLVLFADWARTRLADTLPDNYEVGD